MELFIAALFLATVNERIVEYVAAPLKRRFRAADYWWLLYVALVSGALIGWFSEINLFAAYIPDGALGRILTAIAIGGGSSLLHDIFDGDDAPVGYSPDDDG